MSSRAAMKNALPGHVAWQPGVLSLAQAIAERTMNICDRESGRPTG